MKNFFVNKLFLAFILIAFFSLLVELILRSKYGFTDAVLMREDKNFEYISVPQNRFRFGKKNYYNEYSQRNTSINPTDSIILGFGDSVLNGGTQTDQDSLATSLLSSYLSKKYSKKVLFVNISAGSWGPDNCYAYLKKYGNFGAKSILLVVSSHDAHDNMTFEKVVGVNVDYPDKQYKSALMEVADRYVYNRYIKSIFQPKSDSILTKNNSLLISKYHKGMAFNAGFAKFKQYADSCHLPLLVYLHAEKEELKTRSYDQEGQEIINFCKNQKINLVKELDYNFKPNDYRDEIHLSEAGQHHLFTVLKLFY